MSPEDMIKHCMSIRNKFYGFTSIIKRGLNLLRINPSPVVSAIFWAQNIRLRVEVEGKNRIPVGRGLDELPK
jgi:hypothetical protein